MDEDGMPVFLGVSVAAGTIYMGAVRCPNLLLLDDPAMRIELAQRLDTAAALRDIATRFGEELRRMQPAAVGLVHTRNYRSWPYGDAFNKASVESAVMIAANEHGIPVDWVKQEQIHKETGIPLKTYHTDLAAKLGLAVPTYWSNRAIAFGAALTMAACRP